MRKDAPAYIAYNVRETYHELGTFEFKLVFDTTAADPSTTDLSILDSDGKPVPFRSRRWGKKLNCSFDITDEVADGVAVVNLSFTTVRGEQRRERLTFWVIK